MTGEGEGYRFRSNFRAKTRLETLATQATRSGAYLPLIFQNEILEVKRLVRKQCFARGTGSCIHLEKRRNLK